MEKNDEQVEVGGRHKIDDVALIERRDREIERLLDALMQEKRETARLREAVNKAYTERNRLVAFIAWHYPSGVTKTDIPGWDEAWHNCVYIDLPTGQASWHYHDDDAHLFDGLPLYNEQWDGHTTDEKYERVERAALGKDK